MKAEKQTAALANGTDASVNAFKARFLSPVQSTKMHAARAAVKETEGLVLDPTQNIVSGLQAELYATRRALHELMFDLGHEIQSHAVDTARALLAVQKYQMAKSALLATKDALDHLNQDMTTLNNQLRKALERHRSTAGYLENVLESTDIAMLFVDADLKICFFTPAAQSVFRVVLADVGRPLADLAKHPEHVNLASDAQSVLDSRKAIERNLTTAEGMRFLRHTQHCSAERGRARNLVITSVDITEDKRHNGACAVAELAPLPTTRIAGATSQDPDQTADADRDRAEARSAAQVRFSKLTQRQRAIMLQVLEGKPNKIIAADLRINQRTVENHRAAVMRKTGTTSLPALVRLAISADISIM